MTIGLPDIVRSISGVSVSAFETPRNTSASCSASANALLRRVRDFAMVKGEGHIDLEITRIALAALNIDSRGLDQMDNKILGTIIEKFNGGPVGLNTVATAVGEEAGTIEEVYEPFLIKEGFLQRTPRGREATPLAYQHLGFTHPRDGEASLF